MVVGTRIGILKREEEKKDRVNAARIAGCVCVPLVAITDRSPECLHG